MMNINIEQAKRDLRAKVVELASEIDVNADCINDNDIIPESGYLDSGSILEFIVWIEQHFNIPLKQSEITIDNFGSINAIIAYLSKKTNTDETYFSD